jgi:hypothetical protein
MVLTFKGLVSVDFVDLAFEGLESTAFDVEVLNSMVLTFKGLESEDFIDLALEGFDSDVDFLGHLVDNKIKI